MTQWRRLACSTLLVGTLLVPLSFSTASADPTSPPEVSSTLPYDPSADEPEVSDTLPYDPSADEPEISDTLPYDPSTSGVETPDRVQTDGVQDDSAPWAVTATFGLVGALISLCIVMFWRRSSRRGKFI